MKPEEEPTQKPAAGKPVGKLERQVTRQPPGATKPAELTVFNPRPRTASEAARPAAPPKAAPPPALPPKPKTEVAPLAPPGKQIRVLLGAGKVRYFTFPQPPAAAAKPPPAAAPRQTPPTPPAAKPAAPAAPGATQAPPPACAVKRLKLTDRDRQLMGLLATTRYLSLEQMQRLISPERNGIDLHKRTLALGGEGKYGVERPYLKRLSYRNWLGEPQTAWMLTPLGYNVAETVLAAPPRRPTAATGANFIEHGLFANELYVQLLEAPLKLALAAARARAAQEERPSRSFTRTKAGLYARATHPGLIWQSHDEVRLPWREYDVRTRQPGVTRDRVIIPDATLELRPAEGSHAVPSRIVAGSPAVPYRDRSPAPPVDRASTPPCVRVFLEAETGSQTVEPEGDTKPGATLNKLDRYTRYLRGFADFDGTGDRRSWYEKAYPDGFEPTLLFMVKDAGRAAVVTGAIEEWQRKSDMDRIHAKALTVEGAAAWLLSVLGPGWATAAPPTPATATRPEPRQKTPRVVTSAEYVLLQDYARSAHTLIQRYRADVRNRGEVPPEYPEETDAMNGLLAKLFR